MKQHYSFVVFFVALLCSTTLSAQYSNATLNGAWLGRNFNPDTYMIFDGNGTVKELGVHYDHTSISSIGTYSITPTGVLSGSISIDGEIHPLGGQCINVDSINGIQTGGIVLGTLSRIKNPNLLEGNWSGKISNYSDISFSINSMGQITGSPNLIGHLFSKNGQVVGFITNTALKGCWNMINVNGNYINGTIRSFSADPT